MFQPPKLDISWYEKDPIGFSLELGYALETEGVVSINGINQDIIDDMYDEIGTLFDSPLKKSLTQYKRSEETKRDFFSIRGNHPNAVTLPYESKFPNLQNALASAYDHLHDLAAIIAEASSQFYGNEKPMKNFARRPKELLIQRYDPMPWLQFPPKKLRLREHDHWNCTLLPPASLEGLEILTKAGKWEQVPLEDGHALFLPGEWSDMSGLEGIKAMKHRVVNPPNEKRKLPRYVSVFLFL